MRIFTAILFCIIFMFATMQQVSLFVLYKLNEKSITEKYCVNKDKPTTHCNGKCHLQKTIKSLEKEDTKNPFSVLQFKLKEIEYIVSKIHKIEILNSFYTNEINLHFNKYSSNLLVGYLQLPTKPPTLF